MSSIRLSLAIYSVNPKKLAEFYAFATNGKLKPGKNQKHWEVVVGGGLKIHLYKPSQNEPTLKKGRVVSLCLEKEPSQKPLSIINEWAEILVCQGAKISLEPKVEPFGTEAWMTDPEENDFLIFVPTI